MSGENVNQGDCSEPHQHDEHEHGSDEWDDETVEWYVKNWGITQPTA